MNWRLLLKLPKRSKKGFKKMKKVYAKNLFDPDVPLYITIAEHIKEVRVFDMRYDNEEELKNIYWLIAWSLADIYGWSMQSKLNHLPTAVGRIKNCLYPAEMYLRDKSIGLFKMFNSPSGKLIRCISIDPKYKGIKKKDFRRLKRNARIKIQKFAKDMKDKHPMQLEKMRGDVTRLTNKLNRIE